MKTREQIEELGVSVRMVTSLYMRAALHGQCTTVEDVAQVAWLAALEVAAKPFVSRRADGGGFGALVFHLAKQRVQAHVITASSPVCCRDNGTERLNLFDTRIHDGLSSYTGEPQTKRDGGADTTRSRVKQVRNGDIFDASNPDRLVRVSSVRHRVQARLAELFPEPIVDALFGEREPSSKEERAAVTKARRTMATDPVLRTIWEDS